MPRPDVSEERRPQIINAALCVFARDGYHNATMPAIAAEAGLSIGGLYWYYKSKQQIISAVLAQLFDADLALAAALVAQDAPAGERLILFANNVVAIFDAHRELLPIGVEIYGAAIHDEQARGFVRNYLATYRGALEQLIAQGIVRGEFRSIDTTDAANVLLALIEGTALLWAVDPGNMHYRAAISSGVALFVAGLRKIEDCSAHDEELTIIRSRRKL